MSEITEGLSKKINSKVTCGTIDWGFPNTFVINDLYVEDQSKDTLAFIKRAKVTVNILPLFKKQVSLRTVQLTEMRAFIHQDTPGKFNFQFIVDAFKRKDTTKSNWSADIETVGLKNCYVSFHKDSVNTKPERFNPKFMDVSNLCGHIFVRKLSKDSFNLRLHKLSFTEASGVCLSDLSTTVTGNKKGVNFSYFSTSMPQSKVAFKTAKISYADLKSKNYFHDFNLDFALEPSTVCLYDLRAFVPQFQSLHDVVLLNGSFKGTVDNLKVRNLTVRTENSFDVEGDIDIKGLPKIKEAFIDANFTNVSVNAQQIKHYGSAFINRDIYLPPAVENMDFMAYQGQVKGSLSSIAATGSISTAPGTLNLDVKIDNPDLNFSTYTIDGDLSTSNFHLAQILPTSGLGNTSFGLKVNLHRNGNETMQHRRFSASADGVIDSLEYRNYIYRNITLNGDFGPKGFVGQFAIDDPNAQLDLDGNVNLDSKVPVFNFTASAKHICLGPLNLTKNPNNSCLSFDMDADFKGRNFDELEGSFSIDNFLYQRPGAKDLMMNNLSLNVTPAVNGQKKASLYSDYLNGTISGQYQLAGLWNNTKKIFRKYVPVVIPAAVNKQDGNNFTFNFDISNTEVLTEAFNLPVSMVADGTLNGFFNDVDGKFRMRLEAPMMRVGKNTLEDVMVLCENPQDEAKMIVRGTLMPLKRRRNPYYFSVNANAKSDSIVSRINFSNSVDETYSGELNILSVLKSKTKDGLSADFFVRPTEIILKDTVWNIHESTAELRPGSLTVNNFLLDHDDQELRINGVSTRDMSDSIGVYLQNIQLGYISNMLNHPRLTFDGITNGDVYVHRLFNKPYMQTRLAVDSIYMNSFPLGRHLDVSGDFDTREKAIYFDADFFTHVSKAKSTIFGGVFFAKDSMCIDGDLYDIDLRFLHKYVGTVMSDFKGIASGRLRAFGHFGKIGFLGNPVARNLSFGIDFLNTKYYVDCDTVHMLPTAFVLKNVSARDSLNGTAKVNGRITHSGFSNMKFNIDVDCNNVLALNTAEGDNDMFYGKAFGDGHINISGQPGQVKFAMNVKSRENTVVTIPIGGSADVTNTNFITFVSDEERQTAQEKRQNRRARIQKIQDEKAFKSRILLDMQVECTPASQIQLIMDPRAGDIIHAWGNGAIHMKYDSQTSDFNMLGTYELTKGDYLFTVQSIISRKFNIMSGSQIHFTGSPYAAGLDVQAKYSLNASVASILDDPTYSNMSNTNVDCLLYLTGTIQQPIIKFGLELPNAEEEVRNKLASVINTEETLNRNVASLLALGHFYTMDKSSGASASNNEMSSVGFSTLSSEIGSLLSRINDDVNVGVNYNPGDEASATGQEFEVALSTQFLNDRLSVNGNFGYRENTAANSLNASGNSGILDFDVEYKLNPSGKFRLKAFNRTDNSYFRQNSNGSTQGVGLIYREEFDTYREWLNRYWSPIRGLFSKSKNK